MAGRRQTGRRIRRAVSLNGVSPREVRQPKPADVQPYGRVRRFVQYQVSWKRKEWGMKSVRFGSYQQAYDKVMVMTSPEPWKHWGTASQRNRNADDYWCCAGGRFNDCSCGGWTVREEAEERRKQYPPLEWIRISRRVVTQSDWEQVDQFEVPPDLSPSQKVAANLIANPPPGFVAGLGDPIGIIHGVWSDDGADGPEDGLPF